MTEPLHQFVGEGRRCKKCGNLDYEHEEKWREQAEKTLKMAAWLINDLEGGNGIHWNHRIDDLVRMLEELGYDMTQVREEWGNEDP